MAEDIASTPLDDAPKFIAILSFSALVLSAVHEWAYFQVLGLQFLTISSPLDYLSSALIWLPLALAVLVAFAILNIAVRRIRGGSNKTHGAIFFWLAISIFVVALIGRLWMAGEGVVVILCLMLGFIVLYKSSDMERSITKRSYLFFATMMILIAYVIGLNDAWRDQGKHGPFGRLKLFSPTDRQNVLSLKGNASAREVIVLRNLERGILIRDVNSNVIGFYPWAEVSAISGLAYKP
jgi:uncharacterized membrane protein SirB2